MHVDNNSAVSSARRERVMEAKSTASIFHRHRHPLGQDQPAHRRPETVLTFKLSCTRTSSLPASSEYPLMPTSPIVESTVPKHGSAACQCALLPRTWGPALPSTTSSQPINPSPLGIRTTQRLSHERGRPERGNPWLECFSQPAGLGSARSM